MKRILTYLFLVILTIPTLVIAFSKVYIPLIIMSVVWLLQITNEMNKIKKEKTNQFLDWEIRKYNYNAKSRKEQQEHYKEYINERKNNTIAK